MAFEHNDIATKNRLMGELGEGLMGFEHNDIVTVDKMSEAIAEGGGGGGGNFKTATVNIVPRSGGDGYSFGLDVLSDELGNYSATFVYERDGGIDFGRSPYSGEPMSTTLIYAGDEAKVLPANVVDSVEGNATYDSETYVISITGDCTITGYYED